MYLTGLKAPTNWLTKIPQPLNPPPSCLRKTHPLCSWSCGWQLCWDTLCPGGSLPSSRMWFGSAIEPRRAFPIETHSAHNTRCAVTASSWRYQCQWTALTHELGHGGSWDQKRGWGVQKWRECVEILSSVLQPALLGLTFWSRSPLWLHSMNSSFLDLN